MVFAPGRHRHLAVQLAKRMAPSARGGFGEDGRALVKRLGADAVADGRKDDVEAAARAFAPGGLDAALVTAGGEAADRALRAMGEKGAWRIPTASNPVPKARPGVKVQSFSIEPNPGKSKSSID